MKRFLRGSFLFFSVIFYFGCAGQAIKTGENSTVTVTSTNDVSTELRARIDTDKQLKNIRDYLQLEGSKPRNNLGQINLDNVIILLNGVVLKPGITENNEVVIKSSETDAVFSILNANQGPGSSIQDPVFSLRIEGFNLLQDYFWLDDRYSNKKGIFIRMPGTNIHPSNASIDDPDMFNVPFKFASVKAGTYKGRITLSSLDNEQIIRKFTVRVQ